MNYSGNLTGVNVKIGVVVSRFNEFISERLLAGALDALQRHQVSEKDIDICRVPGAFEIPIIAQKMVLQKKYDAIICLGTLIRGATDHYELICSEVAKGIAKINLDNGLPVIFGIITADTLEDAIERAGAKAGNKGYDAAVAALEMVNLLKQF
ncbi:MAG: 6,7-dimethyl-8-ribityllumazine synthase [Candidatus Cloacimonetes bacterium]|nr:6,7-dimethyl-8-ribityllumazine synthase [Candidatus Cloacimonadota bacterium]